MKLFGNSHTKRPDPSDRDNETLNEEIEETSAASEVDAEDVPEDEELRDEEECQGDAGFPEAEDLREDEDAQESGNVEVRRGARDIPGRVGAAFLGILRRIGAFLQGLTNGKIMALSAVLTLVVVLGAAALVVNYFLDLINYQSADSSYFATVSTEEDLPEETAVNEKLAALDEEEEAESLEATEEELAQWNAQLEDITSDDETYEIPISEDVYNILLIGSDTRTAGEVGRSDAMILVSINQVTETIYLSSFLRDCYVHIPGYGNTRLNHAFAYGGPDLLEETLEENFKVHVDRYIAVDFYSFMDVIDILGGVWLNVTEEEMEITNDYIWSMNKLMDEEWYTDYIWSAGWQKLNGKQTLCYARNRYTGNDYERTQRQRTIISQIISGAMSSSASTLVELAQVILPQVTTDMEKSEILGYVANIGAYLNYEVVSQQIPAAGTYSSVTISGMSVIRLDLDENITYLQNTIYSGTEYSSGTEEKQTAEDFND